MMKIHTTEALMKAEISRRSLMKTSALGSLALASSAFTLPFSQMVRAAQAPVEQLTHSPTSTRGRVIS